MLKKINNIYDYIDYRIVLTEDFIARSTKNHKYSMRAYSRDLDLSPSFLSDVLRGKKELSPQKGRDTFSRLGFQLEELDYIENLISYRNPKDSSTKQSALDFIRSKFKRNPLVSNQEKSLIIKSADHFILHGIVGCTPELKNILKAAESMAITENRAYEVLNEMASAGYFEVIDDHYTLKNINLNVPSHTDLLTTQLQFVQRLVNLIEKQGGLTPPTSISNYFAFGLDENTLPLAAEAYKHLINTLTRLSEQTPIAERYAFFSSTFFTTLVETEKTKNDNQKYEWPAIPV